MHLDKRIRWLDKIHRRSAADDGPLCGITRKSLTATEPPQVSDDDDAVTCSRCRNRLSVVELMRRNAGKH
jgi:hypothetical protein